MFDIDFFLQLKIPTMKTNECKINVEVMLSELLYSLGIQRQLSSDTLNVIFSF